MRSFAATAALAATAAAAASDHWAVIMAGSKGYSNYRHQSDAHHAVKIMLDNGIPRENIIHLSYDDVANARRNPYKGQLFNAPVPTLQDQAELANYNVYDESNIDYSGTEVNKTNFFKVLLGDDSASGPVLKSNENSRVFIYYVDHGGVGLICTPDSSSKEWIYADELDETLQTMKDNGMFKELVFYLETCESGSMFPTVDASENIYAMTASNASESSWGAYCGSEAKVDDVSIGSCLGDLFSINWMQDTTNNDISAETLDQQYETVKTLTTKSPVMKFGDYNFMTEPIGDFQGTLDISEMDYFSDWKGKMMHEFKKTAFKLMPVLAPEEPGTQIDSRDIDLQYLTEQASKNDATTEDIQALNVEIEHRMLFDGLFGQEFFGGEEANAPEFVNDYDCLRLMLGGIEQMCGEWNSYSLKYVRKLATVCDTKTEEDIAQVYYKIGQYCNAI